MEVFKLWCAAKFKNRFQGFAGNLPKADLWERIIKKWIVKSVYFVVYYC